MDKIANNDETENSHEFEKRAVLATVLAVEEVTEGQTHFVVQHEGVDHLHAQHNDQNDLEDQIDAE